MTQGHGRLPQGAGLAGRRYTGLIANEEGALDDAVKRFISAVPPDRRPLFDRLRVLIERLYPDATLSLRYGVPTYGTQAGWVALGYWKNDVSLYTNGRHNIAGFQTEHPRIKTGTGTINLRATDGFPEEALSRVIRRAMDGVKES